LAENDLIGRYAVGRTQRRAAKGEKGSCEDAEPAVIGAQRRDPTSEACR